MPRQAPFGVLPAEAGWTAVLRVGETLDEERLCLELLALGVAAHPGFFYDFASKGHLVVSLIVFPEVIDTALERVMPRLESRPNG